MESYLTDTSALFSIELLKPHKSLPIGLHSSITVERYLSASSLLIDSARCILWNNHTYTKICKPRTPVALAALQIIPSFHAIPPPENTSAHIAASTRRNSAAWSDRLSVSIGIRVSTLMASTVGKVITRSILNKLTNHQSEKNHLNFQILDDVNGNSHVNFITQIPFRTQFYALSGRTTFSCLSPPFLLNSL